jgi:hypothetical protein
MSKAIPPELGKHPWMLVIGERGFIFAGRVHRDGDRVIIEDAYTVLKFAHEKKDGLGGLAERGPTNEPSNDSLAAQRRTGIPIMAVLADIECNQEAWERWHARKTKK